MSEITITCLACGKHLLVPRCRVGKKRYCSVKCRWSHTKSQYWNGFDREKFATEYQLHTIQELAGIYGVSETTITSWSNKLGIKKRVCLFDELNIEEFKENYHKFDIDQNRI